LKIAKKELDSGVLPISVNRPMPKRKEEPLEKIKIEESKVSDEAKEAVEKQEEKDIASGGEMMGLADSGEEPDVEEAPVMETESSEDRE